MDAHNTVTVEEGDRYPLRPPKKENMPCIKCSNGKYKYGERGRCQFDTLEACHAAEAAIHARDKKEQKTTKEITNTKCCEDCTNCGDCSK